MRISCHAMTRFEKLEIRRIRENWSWAGVAASRLLACLICFAVLPEEFLLQGQPAEPDSLKWTAAPQTARVAVPFAASIQAVDANGTSTTNFNGTVRMS